MVSRFAPLTILAGSGLLPKEICDYYCAHTPHAKTLQIIGYQHIDYSEHLRDYKVTRVELGNFTALLELMKENGSLFFLMAGTVQRVSLSDISLDSIAKKLLKKEPFTLLKGDDYLLRRVAETISEHSGATWIGVKDVYPVVCVGTTKVEISEDDHYDIARGCDILRKLSDEDVGQAIVIQKGVVLGIEAAEGTQKLIERTSTLKKNTKKPILVKMAKVGQSTKVDMPAIGPDTIIQLAKAGYGGVAFDKEGHVIDEEKTIALCHKHRIFLKIL